MRTKKARRLAALLAALALTTTVAAPLPSAGAASSKQMAKQIKTLKQQATALTARLSDLQAKASALEADGPVTPSLLGPAGGDLTGSYPNPQIRTGAIGTSQLSNGAILGRQLVPNALTGAHLADSSIGAAELTSGLSIGQNDLVAGSVGGPQLLDAFVMRDAEGALLRFDALGGVDSFERVAPDHGCPPGTRILAAGLEQDLTKPSREWDDVVATQSVPNPDHPDGWEITVWLRGSEARDPFQVPISESRSFFVTLLCLREA